MIQINKNKIEYKYLQCQQCGICKSICPKQAISFILLKNGLHKVTINTDKCILCKKCKIHCPANKKNVFNGYFKSLLSKQYFLGYNINNKIRSSSSSGGVCKTLIIKGLTSGLIDGAYSLKTSNNFPYAVGEFYTQDNIPDYDMIPNSVYHSVMLCSDIEKIQQCNRLMIVGTTCQLNALEKALKGKYQQIIKICIFCKQQKTLNSTRFLAKMIGNSPINISTPFKVQYRGMGWPGTVQIEETNLLWSRAAQLPFGRRLWTVPGCNICGDPFGMNCGADITLMDPWEIKQPNNLGETLVIAHTQKGLDLLKETPQLKLEEKTYKEIEPALGLKDIWRKQQLIPYFLQEKCSIKVKIAGKAEQIQRHILQAMVKVLPRLPVIGYRIICKFPDLRNLILK